MYFEQSLFVDSIAAEERVERAPPNGQEKPGKVTKTVETGTCKFRVPVSCAFGMHFVVAEWV